MVMRIPMALPVCKENLHLLYYSLYDTGAQGIKGLEIDTNRVFKAIFLQYLFKMSLISSGLNKFSYSRTSRFDIIFSPD